MNVRPAVTRTALVACAIACDVIVHLASAQGAPRRLAIYYGSPALVEDAAGNVTRAVSVFSRYDVIVFGDGLELADSSRDAGLQTGEPPVPEIIRRLHLRPNKPMIYGYISLGRSQQLADAEIVRRIDAWRRLGADGIFFDEAGKEFGVRPPRRSAAVAAVHERGLSALMNAANPDDLFVRPPGARGDARSDLGSRDALLIESFAVRNSVVLPRDEVRRRADAAIRWRNRTGIQVYAVATSVAGRFDVSAVVYAARLAADLGVDAFGWGEPNFSADTKLPWRFEP